MVLLIDTTDNALDDPVVASPTTAGLFTLKLTGTLFPRGFRLDLGKPPALTRAKWTGLRVELDPQGLYKPSRVLGLTVDNADIPVSRPRKRLSPLTWELEGEAAV